MAITWTDDNTSINTCEAKGDWAASGFSNPDDNNSGSATPIFREGTGCMQASAAKGTTGYWYDTIAFSLTGKALVVWIWFSGPTELAMFDYFSVRGYDGTNYVDYDMLPEMQVLDVGGWFPAVCWMTPSGEAHITNSGTPVVSSMDEFRMLADQTDPSYDVKLVGWDYIHAIGYIGAAGDTVTLEDFVLRDAGQNFGVFTQKGTTFQTQVNVRLGGTGTTTVNEANKTLSFRGANEDQPVGFVFNTGGTAINFTVTDMVFNWAFNSETGQATFSYLSVTPSIFKLVGCAFNGAPDIELPYYNVAHWVRNCKFNGCREINIKDATFEENTVSNATSGVKYVGTGTRRAKDNTYLNNTDAIHVDTVQNLTLDGDTFSGNTDDVHFSGNCSSVNAGSFVVGNAYKIAVAGTTDFTAIGAADNVVGTKFIATGIGSGTGSAYHILLVNCTNGANATSYRATGTNGDVLINNPVTHRLYGLQNGSEVTYTQLPATAAVTGNNGQTTINTQTFTDATKTWTVNAYKGHLLVIESGSDIGRYNILSNTVNTLTVTPEKKFTATGSGITYKVYNETNTQVVFHVESVTGNETNYQYNYSAGIVIDILVFHINYEDIVFTEVTLGSSDADVPVQQQSSFFYLNPT